MLKFQRYSVLLAIKLITLSKLCLFILKSQCIKFIRSQQPVVLERLAICAPKLWNTLRLHRFIKRSATLPPLNKQFFCMHSLVSVNFSLFHFSFLFYFSFLWSFACLLCHCKNVMNSKCWSIKTWCISFLHFNSLFSYVFQGYNGLR